MSDAWTAPDAGATGEAGIATFGDWTRNIRLIFSRGMPILAAWAVVTFLTFLPQIPQWVISIYLAWAGPNASPAVILVAAGGSLVMSLVNLAVAIVLSSVILGLVRALRMVLVEPGSVSGPIDALRIATTRLLPTLGMLVVVMLITFAGMVLCVLPGLIAGFLLGIAGYLVAVTDIEWGAALGKSYELVIKNIVLYLVFWIGLIVFYVVMFGGMGVASVGLALISPLVQAIATPILSIVIGLGVGFPTFIAMSALVLAIEMADSGTAVAE